MDASNLLEASFHLVPYILYAILVDFLIPLPLLFKICLVFIDWPYPGLQALKWITAGYIDTLYLTNEDHRYFTKASAYLGTLFARRGILWFWRVSSLLATFAWANYYILLPICLCLGASWAMGPQNRIFGISGTSASLGAWIFVIVPTNLVYGFTLFLGYALDGLGSMKRAVAAMLIPPLPNFSYDSAPNFDPTTQIRLLKLHRRVPFFEVSAELVSCAIEEAPTYYAISYVWSYGRQDFRTITLNGMSFKIRRNVYDILNRCSSFLGPQTIWIDTICIDQSNNDEKTFQVRAMQDIYSTAEHVLVCLGNGPGALALFLIRELKNAGQLFGEARVPEYVAQFFERRKTDPWLAARIDALQELLQHPWFRRVWVIQEAVVPRAVTFFYGRQSIPWQEFYKLKAILTGPLISMFASLTPGDQLENVFWYRGILSMNFIVAYRLEYHIFGPQRISHVLRIFGEREAKLPIDKVFALVGIAKRYDTDLKQLVDYRIKSDETVLLDLAIFLFDHEEAFEILYLAGIGRGGRNPNLPSWVVDWTMQCANTPLNSEFLPEALRYRAATSKPLRAMRGTSQREIIVRGQLFDKITGLVPLHTNVTGRESFTDIHLLLGSYLDETLKLAREKSRDPYPHAVNQSLDEAVWRTLIGDKTNTERPAPASYAHILARLNQGFADLKDPLSRYFPELRFSEVTKENIRNGNAQIEMEKLLASMESIEQMQNIDILFDSGKGSSPYVFCVTAQGFIGMVPQLSQVEDSIVLLHGMEVPYLLRGGDVKWRYQLVGDAYVHGIMDGEGVSGDGEDFTLV